MKYTYYFIAYMYGSSVGKKRLCNLVIAEHPFKWERASNKQYPGQYVLQNYQKISKREYDMYVGIL